MRKVYTTGMLPHFAFRITPEDRALLEAVAAKDRLPMAAVLLRALRFYAEHIGVKVPKPKARRRRP